MIPAPRTDQQKHFICTICQIKVGISNLLYFLCHPSLVSCQIPPYKSLTDRPMYRPYNKIMTYTGLQNIFVVVGYWYLTSLISAGSILIRWRLLVCESCKRRKWQEDGEWRYRLNFNFISFEFLHVYSVARNVFLDYLRTVVSPKSGVEIHKLFSGLIYPNSVFFSRGLIYLNSLLLYRVLLTDLAVTSVRVNQRATKWAHGSLISSSKQVTAEI